MYRKKNTCPFVFSLYVLAGFISIIGIVPANVLAQLDDPTRPPGYRQVLPGGKRAATRVSYNLSSVFISAARRAAVINDKSVEQGGYVNGAKVVAINPSSVKLQRKGKVFTIKLLSQKVTKTKAR